MNDVDDEQEGPKNTTTILHYILLRGQRSKSSTKWHMKAAVLEAELHILYSFSFKNKNTEIYFLKHTSIMSLN